MNAETTGQTVDLLLQRVSVATDDDDLGAVLLCQLSLLERAGRANDVRAKVACHLAKVEANAAGGWRGWRSG